MKKKLGLLFCGLVVVGFMATTSDARLQYHAAVTEQKDDPAIKETFTAMEKLGTKFKQCGHCHGKKKSERTPFADKIATFLLEKKYVTKDEEKENEYNYDKTKWTKDADGKYPAEALQVIKAAIEAASK